MTAQNLKRDFVHLVSSSGDECEQKSSRHSSDDALKISKESLYYWQGLSRLTPFSFDGVHCHTTSSTGDPCLTFQEIFGNLKDLKMGILSAMCIDWDWLQQELFVATQIPLIFVTDYDRPRKELDY